MISVSRQGDMSTVPPTCRTQDILQQGAQQSRAQSTEPRHYGSDVIAAVVVAVVAGGGGGTVVDAEAAVVAVAVAKLSP